MLHCNMPRKRLSYVIPFTRLLKSRRLVKATLALQSAWLKGLAGGTAPARATRPAGRARKPPNTGGGATFRLMHFQFGADRYRYRLFVPPRAAIESRPVIVMLHGCEQDAADFALGTDMNAVARRSGAIVVYPEQLRKANRLGCWNWFSPRHQQRDVGEAAMIAALALRVAARHGGDRSRIYVAGLSAGGAMAALTAALHPEVFAAVGVHSGLAAHAAHDAVSAVQAMRRGAVPHAPHDPQRAVPTIVFQGSADRTVRPANAEAIVQGQLAAWAAAGVPLRPDGKGDVAVAPRAVCTTWVDATGAPRLQAWQVQHGRHAWSGGKAAGTYTEPDGPGASRAMLRFFLRQRRS